MALRDLIYEGPRRSPARRASRHGLVQLGWPHFWVLAGILGGMLALFIAILFAHLSTT